MRPAAGMVGALAHPAQGAWKSLQKSWAQEQEQYQRQTRIADGVGAVQGGSRLDRDGIVEKFRQAKATTNDRQKAYKDIAEKEMYGNDQQHSTSTLRTYASSTSSRASISSATSVRSEIAAQASTASQDEDASFERDLEFAKQLSLAEQRGYERGLARAK